MIVGLITWAKIHPFLALIIGGLRSASSPASTSPTSIVNFSTGFGDTAAGVGILIALGAMFGKLLADSGGADEIVDAIVGRASARTLPWAMALVGAIIGLPMFFEIGLVLLMPVIYLVARRAQLSLIAVGIPALAGLSAMHGLVPPHPGSADRDRLRSAPTSAPPWRSACSSRSRRSIVSGPLFAPLAARGCRAGAGPVRGARSAEELRASGRRSAVTLATVLLPVVLMMGKALADIIDGRRGGPGTPVLDVLGTPVIALLIAVIVAIFTFGRGAGMARDDITKSLESSLPADRRHPADRLRGRRVQAGAGRHRHRHQARRLGDRRRRLGAAAGLGARRAHPAGHRLGHRRDDHRLGLMVGLADGLSSGETSLVVLADRCRLGVLLPRQRRRASGWSRSTSA